MTDPLDDYEEGEWTPVPIYQSPTGTSWATSTTVGRYTKIGEMVVLVEYPSNSATFTINGHPFEKVTTDGSKDDAQ